MSGDNSLGRAVFFDKVAATLFIIVAALSPLFFIPSLGLPVDLSKIYFLIFGVLLVFLSWIIARLVDGAITVPKTPILLSAVIVPVAFLVSALFSPAPAVSFAGTSFGIGSVAVILLLTLSFLGSVLYLNSPHRVSFFLKIILGSTLVIALFQITYLFFGLTHLHFGTFYSNISNLVGRWNDLGIFFGAVALGSITLLEIAELSRMKRVGLWLLFVLSLFFLALVNFPLLWGILAAFSILLLVYALTVLRPRREGSAMHFPVAAFVAVLVALLFLIANPIVGTILPRFFGVSSAEVRPSIVATASVTWQSLKQSPIVGVGPNRFENAWLMYRPNQVIATDFWDTGFTSGFGLIPSFIATTGVLGTLAILAFLLLFFIAGILHVFRSHENKGTQTLMLLSFILATYAWIVALAYNPGIVGVMTAFVFSGMFIGLLGYTKAIPVVRRSFLEDPRKSFFSILALVAILILALAALFIGTEKFIALSSYARGVQALSKNDMTSAETLLTRAATLNPSDLYYRGLASLRLAQIKKLVTTPNVSQDVLKQNFQTLFSAAEGAAQNAVHYDKTNPANWVALGSLYESVVPFGVSGAYTNAKQAYEEARKLSPQNPGFDLLRAQLEVDNKNLADAKTFAEQAIAAKANFVSGYILLAQINSALGDSASAEANLEKAVMVAPTDTNANLELGLFKFKANDFQGAIPSLERALYLDRSSATAAYFLGLSYDKVGRTTDALAVFTALEKAFPNDTVLPKIVANLQAGKSALDSLVAAPEPVKAEEDKKTTTKK